MNLKDILNFKQVVIQCHNEPDPDAIASAFGLWSYLNDGGIKARIIYGGMENITKPNVILMLKLLAIPLEYAAEISSPELLITVDCQYGAGNVAHFDCKEFAVFDHHRQEIPDSGNLTIRPQLGSCATLIWDLLLKEGFDFAAHPNVITALVYGLLMDTLEGAESRHPLDRDLADFNGADRQIIKLLMNSAITMNDLQIVANALSTSRLLTSVGLLKAEPCDPNLLGFVCDVAKQVDRFDCCVVYGQHNAGVKLSVRSCVREVMADELACFITDGIGSGGGNLEKAGGYFSSRALNGTKVDDFITSKIVDYQTRFSFIYPERNKLDFKEMPRYRKLPLALGYVPATQIFPEGTHIRVRTLEGDLDIKAEDDIYLMIGAEGEVYPIKKVRFNECYNTANTPHTTDTEYAPSVIDLLSGKKSFILSHAKTCFPKKDKFIRAEPIDKDVKVFTAWDTQKYFLGRTGDYIAASENDFNDIYIIKRNIMAKTYERIDA
jgi:phosphoglycolate phosphatase